ncbi:hypothetical protein ZWY2020_057102 [Hordeum vulgare]|nr:hypothetical protein ZWY2020_057102 [Hordeum vulgare]
MGCGSRSSEREGGARRFFDSSPRRRSAALPLRQLPRRHQTKSPVLNQLHPIPSSAPPGPRSRRLDTATPSRHLPPNLLSSRGQAAAAPHGLGSASPFVG